MIKKVNSQRYNTGFTLFIAVVITATLLLVSTGIISLAVKEAFLTSASRDSQTAFYAADTGIECALYWDVKNPSGVSAFDISASSQINCNQDSSNAVNPDPSTDPYSVGGTDFSSFTLTFKPSTACAYVTVTKRGSAPKTTIQAFGYNTCDPGNPRRVERAVRVTY